MNYILYSMYSKDKLISRAFVEFHVINCLHHIFLVLASMYCTYFISANKLALLMGSVCEKRVTRCSESTSIEIRGHILDTCSPNAAPCALFANCNMAAFQDSASETWRIACKARKTISAQAQAPSSPKMPIQPQDMSPGLPSEAIQ
mmetsp:Transcript_10551/g.24620  ORF Transcript_10551/g.24620 Transcript_10551/m.24620 type:complete len:146 (-) Transcript_10551:613-1050(-)